MCQKSAVIWMIYLYTRWWRQRLDEHNVKINIDKCKFLEKSVEYLGHILEYNTIRPNPKKIEAVKAPPPQNVN